MRGAKHLGARVPGAKHPSTRGRTLDHPTSHAPPLDSGWCAPDLEFTIEFPRLEDGWNWRACAGRTFHASSRGTTHHPTHRCLSLSSHLDISASFPISLDEIWTLIMVNFDKRGKSKREGKKEKVHFTFLLSLASGLPFVLFYVTINFF